MRTPGRSRGSPRFPASRHVPCPTDHRGEPPEVGLPAPSRHDLAVVNGRPEAGLAPPAAIRPGTAESEPLADPQLRDSAGVAENRPSFRIF